MLKLLKYEFARRKRMVGATAIFLIVLEILSIFMLYKKGEWQILSITLMVGMFIGLILLIFLDAAISYYSDFKKSQGTMLFLTPVTGSKIIGSKMLYAAIELFCGMIILIIFSVITNSFAISAGYTGIQPYLNEFSSVMSYTFGSTSWWLFIPSFSFLVFLQYFAAIAIVMASVTIGRTLLSRNNYSWLLAILIYIGVSFVVQMVNSLMLFIIGLGDGLVINLFQNQTDISVDITKYLVIGGIMYVLWICAGYLVSSKLLTKRIDL